jgi:hypothetical protein
VRSFRIPPEKFQHANSRALQFQFQIHTKEYMKRRGTLEPSYPANPYRPTFPTPNIKYSIKTRWRTESNPLYPTVAVSITIVLNHQLFYHVTFIFYYREEVTMKSLHFKCSELRMGDYDDTFILKVEYFSRRSHKIQNRTKE